jgi:ethanolamine utilization protein EutP (predicted NTPase)
VIVATKREIASREQVAAVRSAAARRGKTFFAISAAAHQGLGPLVEHLGKRLLERAA